MLIKKTLILLAAIVIAGSTVFAQKSLYSMTVNGALNLSDMDISNLKTKLKAGYNFNATFEYNLPKNFFLQTGIGFSNKGAKVKDHESGMMRGSELATIIQDERIDLNDTYYYASAADGKYNTQYITIPLMGGYRLSVSEKIRMNLSLGPYFGYGIGGKSKTSQVIAARSSFTIPGNGMNESNDFTIAVGRGYDVKSFDILKRFDMGLRGNVGIEYHRFLLNVGYEYGFINQIKEGDGSSYNMNLFVGLGFRVF
ncbi:hypothetical protein M2451_000172 [Dysgonomonas sp. PFB1-18]|uniref:porin family protein n=1 Tax=unclassified Dysgonomonas TaxID=2630389 RepID=UPI002476D6D0|nr:MULTISPECIES: porin family protein [unclassified Dysgonomonas]MDH6307723.1 hypothetical protein [Dysgonomonas sp. PF1-14]MDH6337641.1 hypothetical protein [Dysgonomonas sp. PF1-16]MDH6378865.1 hypothetical protein [Dysgonomonas sp. PFB1-18]MDH6396500.1 hypothetical protein [Dysgonomonas sp. PF1-23]